jgi:multiple sugar transport system substrate-binding protein
MAGSRIRLAALAAVCVLPLSACGGVSLSGDDSKVFSTMGLNLTDQLATSRLDDARKALAPLKVQVPPGAFDAQQFLSAVAAGDPPDVAVMDRQLVGGFAAKGALIPLTHCLKSQHVDTSVYRTAAFDETRLDGVQYSLPDSYDSRMLLINGKALKETGLTKADLDTADWSRLRATTKKLVTSSGGKLTRVGFYPKLPEFFPLWVRANGGALLSADGKHAELDSPKTVQALEYAVGLIKEQGGWGKVKSLNDSYDFFGAQNEFVRNQVGAFPMEDWYFNVLALNSPKVPLETEPFRDRQGRAINYTSGLGWVIPKGSKHPDQACTFIKTMTSTKVWVKAAAVKAAATRKQHKPYFADFTGNKAADAQIMAKVWKPTGNATFDAAVRELYAAQDHSFAVPSNPAGNEFSNAWQKAVNRALDGQQSPRDSLRQAQREAQRALDLANEGSR